MKTPWIPTKEILPPDGAEIVAVYVIGKGSAARLSWVAGVVEREGSDLYINTDYNQFTFDDITHWMPIRTDLLYIADGEVYDTDKN